VEVALIRVVGPVLAEWSDVLAVGDGPVAPDGGLRIRQCELVGADEFVEFVLQVVLGVALGFVVGFGPKLLDVVGSPA
jgi:hypothetical protein